MFTRMPPGDTARMLPGTDARTITSSTSVISGTVFAYTSNAPDERHTYIEYSSSPAPLSSTTEPMLATRTLSDPVTSTSAAAPTRRSPPSISTELPTTVRPSPKVAEVLPPTSSSASRKTLRSASPAVIIAPPAIATVASIVLARTASAATTVTVVASTPMAPDTTSILSDVSIRILLPITLTLSADTVASDSVMMLRSPPKFNRELSCAKISSSSVTTSFRPFMATDMSSEEASDMAWSVALNAKLGEVRLMESPALTTMSPAATSTLSPATTLRSLVTPSIASPVLTLISVVAKISAVMARSCACPVAAERAVAAVMLARSLRKSMFTAFTSARSPNDSIKKSAAIISTSPPA